jgi:BirA family biotin operon repressor/biotin-[acetyl-CoA-carboxylase] ligase
MPTLLEAKLVELAALLNDQAYHSDLSLSRALSLSPSMTQAMLQTLMEYKVPIMYDLKKGYALQAPLTLLDQSIIVPSLKAFNFDNLFIFESIPSTHVFLKHESKPKAMDLCLAECQTQGRGRFSDRAWYSPFGCNIYLSITYCFKKNTHQLNGLPLVVALSAANVMNVYSNLQESIFIKWPNDLMYRHKKLAGVLIESLNQANGFSKVFISIGINVNLDTSQATHLITQPITSLRDITHRYWNRNALIIQLVGQLLQDLNRFEQAGLSAFMSDWQKKDYFYQKNVIAKCRSQVFRGIAEGVTPLGYLKLKQAHHSSIELSTGEVCLDDIA